MSCLMCDHPADTNGFCERCYDDLHNGGKSDAIKVVNRLLAINAKQAAELAEAAAVNNAALRKIQDTELRFDRYAANANRTEKIKDARIAELERQLAATLTTIEAAAWCNQCNLPDDHCRENHDGALYAEGCAP